MRQEIPQSEIDLRPLKGVRRAKLLRIAAQGFNATRAAELLGVSPATTQKEYADPSFREQLLSLVESAFESSDGVFGQVMFNLQDRLRMKAEEAFDTLAEIMDDTTQEPALRAKVAMNFLDRTPETQQGHQVRYGAIEDASTLARAARAAEEMNNVVPFPGRPPKEQAG
jgi:hypothetical protein